MEIRKKDYSKTLDFIIAELKEDGYDEMVSYLERNPPKKYRKMGLLSITLSESLMAAKQFASPQYRDLDLTTLESIQEHRNLRTVLENKQRKAGWFNQLKAMGGTVLEDPKTILEVNTETDPEDDDDKCQCDADQTCPLTATWKNPKTGVKCCDKHFQEVVAELRGNHGFMPWNCEEDEYYKYREDM